MPAVAAVMAWMAMRATSAVSITLRRGRRSAKTPPASRKTTSGAVFAAITKLGSLLGANLRVSDAGLRLDELMCALCSWNTKYHPETFVDWVLPTNVFYVLRKPPR